MKYNWMRQFLVDINIGTIRDAADLDAAWDSMLQGRDWEVIHYMSCGFADSQYALMFFKDGTVELGVGESMRGYRQLYKGRSAKKGWKTFMDVVLAYTWKETKGDA